MIAPGPSRRQLFGLLLLVAWTVAAYAVGIAVIARIPWGRALWQACICLIAAPVLLTAVIKVIGASKKLAHLASAVYLALDPMLTVTQYALPWLGWSALIVWTNGGRVSWSAALLAGGLVAAVSYLTGFGIVLALRPRASDVELSEIEVGIEGLPAAFDGYRIVHISDTHGGSWLVRASVSERLARAASVESDIVVFTGDLAPRPEVAVTAAATLARLKARDGRFAVLGNHDHWIGEERMAGALAGAGFRVLGNEHIALERGGERLYLAGVKDASYTRMDDLPAALRGIPEGAPVIVITHSPDLVRDPMAHRAALILAGHTHGGQVVFPWIGPLYIPTRLGRRRMSGLHEVNGARVYINRGLGEISPPFRLNCPPEIAVITLRSL